MQLKKYSQNVLQTENKFSTVLQCGDCDLKVTITVEVETPKPICPNEPCITCCELMGNVREKAYSFIQQFMPPSRDLVRTCAEPMPMGREGANRA